MERYAKSLWVFGFVLAAWAIYRFIWGLWQIWSFKQMHGFDEFPPSWFHTILNLWPTLQLGVASVLLLRLSGPATVGNVERHLARFWAIPSLCFVGFAFWVSWGLAHSHYPMALARGSYCDTALLLIPLLVTVAVVPFTLGALPPLCVLSRQTPSTH